MGTEEFRELVWQESRSLYRDMPWRDEPTFYYVLVSEIMLQQTQVPRVLIKFTELIATFPTIEALASAKLADVLRAWSGLGYNRRAKFLHEAAKYVVVNGQPNTRSDLTKLPGVGTNTAAALMNYVYEVPTPYIETNIRTVFLHHFFTESTDVTDAEILERVNQTIDSEHPRQWFWAIMDYGTLLKGQRAGRLQQSKHYKRQTPLKGSVREVRGQIIKELTQQPFSDRELRNILSADDRFEKALTGLVADGLVRVDKTMYYLAS